MTRKRVISGFIILFWLTMMSLLVYRHLPRPGEASQLIQLERFSKSTHDRQWMSIHLGKKIGYSMTSIAKMTNEQTNVVTYSFLQRVFIHMRVGHVKQKITLMSTAKADADFQLLSFEANVVSGVHQIKISGEVKDKALHLIVVSSGRENEMVYPIKDNVQLPITLEPYLASHGLETGKTYSMEVFDPMSVSSDPVTVEVGEEDRLYLDGKPYIARKINLTYRNMESTVWMDYDGRTLKEVTPMGMYMQMVSEEDARRGIDTDGESVDLLAIYSIVPKHPIESPRELRQCKLKLEGIDPGNLSLPSANQTILSEDPITIEITQPELGQILSLPISQLDDKTDTLWLAATPFIQTQDEKICKQAEDILDGETDALQAAIKLQSWVFASIKKQFTFSIPSAVEVLTTMEGDCNEHTTLFTALARSVGIPARMCVGLAYVNGGFYYHAWPEVYVGEWLTMDPTFGQNAVDATHIKLLEGDLSKQFELGSVLGKVDLTILELNGEPVSE
ncbi:MAG: hypothetical protein B6244_13565 [Candidatus Cloacimonetes bacterium 4572_55]|nr:MAG: hypothetical protein B6244_13565 [Candidatus Cloacimonetes bacterium 4572_55]